MPNRTWASRAPKAALQRAPQRADRRSASAARASLAGQATHSSSCMTMSEPSRSAWISMDRSGESAWRDPSRWLWNVTPVSSTLAILDSDMTWKPPLSVRIGRSQPMNRCNPPSLRTRSAVGRSIRW